MYAIRSYYEAFAVVKSYGEGAAARRRSALLTEDGAVIRAGDVVIDGSLRARLEGLSHALTN